MEADPPLTYWEPDIARARDGAQLVQEFEELIVHVHDCATSLDKTLRQFKSQQESVHRLTTETTAIEEATRRLHGALRKGQARMPADAPKVMVLRRCAKLMGEMEDEIHKHQPSPSAEAEERYQSWNDLRCLGRGIRDFAGLLRPYQLTIAVMVAAANCHRKTPDELDSDELKQQAGVAREQLVEHLDAVQRQLSDTSAAEQSSLMAELGEEKECGEMCERILQAIIRQSTRRSSAERMILLSLSKAIKEQKLNKSPTS